MKKLIKSMCFLALVLAVVFSFAGCKEEGILVITVQSESVEEGDTLKNYMDKMQSKGEITFTIRNGMIISINGKAGAPNQYWMLYTDDVGNSNSAWGTYDYNGTTYSLASDGAEGIRVKEDCTYIWVLETF